MPVLSPLLAMQMIVVIVIAYWLYSSLQVKTSPVELAIQCWLDALMALMVVLVNRSCMWTSFIGNKLCKRELTDFLIFLFWETWTKWHNVFELSDRSLWGYELYCHCNSMYFFPFRILLSWKYLFQVQRVHCLTKEPFYVRAVTVMLASLLPIILQSLSQFRSHQKRCFSKRNSNRNNIFVTDYTILKVRMLHY